MTYYLQIKLLSDTTFGRGDGVAGLIDQEVEHDVAGFPYLRGRTLKGLLSEACDNLIALPAVADRRWNVVLKRLFGYSGSTIESAAGWHIGNAELAIDLRAPITRLMTQHEAEKDRLAKLPLEERAAAAASLVPAVLPSQVLEAMTTIRRQTAIDAVTGLPDQGSLRSMRVIIRGRVFWSVLEPTSRQVQDDELALLAAGCAALRHIGAGRNRGRGHVACCLWDAQNDITDRFLQVFVQRMKENA